MDLWVRLILLIHKAIDSVKVEIVMEFCCLYYAKEGADMFATI